MRVFVLVACFLMMSMPISSQTKKEGSKIKKEVHQTLKTQTSVSTTTATINSNSPTDRSDKALEDEEKSEVLIDSSIYSRQDNEQSDDEGIPYSFGIVRGVVNIDGKTIVVFESDDGTLSFIQVYKTQNSVKWKVYLQIRRS